jgi:hypothetical protein
MFLVRSKVRKRQDLLVAGNMTFVLASSSMSKENGVKLGAARNRRGSSSSVCARGKVQHGSNTVRRLNTIQSQTLSVRSALSAVVMIARLHNSA